MGSRDLEIPETVTPEEALVLLTKIPEVHKGDWECAHCDADDVLCSLLRHLGHGDVVDAFSKIGKWYA
jgi:hypothetical protein